MRECAGVDVDKDDNVWVFNRGKYPVAQFDKNGNLLQAWENTPIVAAHGLEIAPNGNVWLVDVAGHAVLECDRQGRIRTVIANAGGGPGEPDSKYLFNRPTALAFTPEGDFFVSDGYVDSRVVKFTKNSEYVTQWGRKGTGDGKFDLVHDVTLDSKGLVYVAGEDAIYMADGVNNRVVKLNLDGQVLGVLGGFGKAPGKFDFAHHVAVDSEGSFYVVEIKNWRIQKFSKTGR